MIDPPTFLSHAERVLAQREADGVRGIKRERSRFAYHVKEVKFAPKPISSHPNFTKRVKRSIARIVDAFRRAS